MNRISQLAIVLVVVGALVLAGPAFGFTTIAADRMVDVATTDTEDALLGVSDTDQTPNQQNDAVVMTITNNAGVDFDSLETDVELEDEDDNLAIIDDFADQLAAGEETGLEVTCDGGGDSTATISVEATADGTGLGISDVTFEHTFDYSCTGAGGGSGPADFDAGDVSTEDSEQRFTFNPDGLTGNDEATIRLNPEGDDVEHVDLDDAAVTLVEGDGDVEIEGDVITYTVGAPGQNDEAVEIELSDFEIDGEPGDVGTVEYEDDDDRDDEDTFEVRDD